MSGIRRREFLLLGGGAAAAWPLAARAQQPAMPVIGFLNGGSEGYTPYLVPFRQGLKEAGYIEGQNVKIEYRWAEGSYDRLPAFAADLVDHHVTVIVVNTPAVRAAQAATKTIPIVFVTGADPVALGFVPSLNRPGGNITGVASLADEVGPKRLEIVRELLPTTSVIALLINPTNPTAETISKDVQASARVLGQVVHILNASTEREIDTAFEKIAELGKSRRGHRMIGRREFITLLGGAAAAWPIAARAQQPHGIRRIGVLVAATADDPEYQARIGAFRQALARLGWTDGGNARIDTRWATTNADEIRRHAAELAALAPDVILSATGTTTVAPLLQATRTVPIVFVIVIDPVGAGFVSSLARPGGNATGFLMFEYGLSAKWLDLIKEIAPGVTRVAVLRDPAIASGIGQFGEVQK